MLSRCLTHAARYVGQGRLDDVARFVQTKYRDDLARQLPLFQAIYAGLAQKGQSLDSDSALGRWGTALANSVLDPESRFTSAWSMHPLTGAASSESFHNPWGVRKRNCADGLNDVLFFDSIVNGEQLTGILRSRPFEIPDSFSFWICGHNGEPGTNPEPVNHVLLKLADGADRGRVIAREIPPRNDTAQKITWDLHQWSGRKGVLEVVDADTGPAYAWLAVGRFEPPVVSRPSPEFTSADRQLALAVTLVEQLQLASQIPRVVSLLSDPDAAQGVRTAAVQAVARVNAAAGQAALEKLVLDQMESPVLRSQAGRALGTINSPASRAALTTAFVGAPSSLEQSLALALAGTPEGTDALLDLVAAGKASPRLLQDLPVVERLKPRLNPVRKQRIDDLTASLPPADQRIRDLVSQRLKKYFASGGSFEKGEALFKTHCSACHKIGDLGQKVGPQLDGIGLRGAERILEDILDPNRNIDGAFRATVIVTKGGLTITGLKLRDEGQVTVLVDTQGKEQRIAADDIDELQISPISPMPSNFAESIPEADFQHLLAWLLAKKSAPANEQ
jgi:putative heme-binding domain-containing protein